jgi:hypothetical protein
VIHSKVNQAVQYTIESYVKAADTSYFIYDLKAADLVTIDSNKRVVGHVDKLCIARTPEC